MASFGETLKRERELREISLREIADATKINLRYLEALEHDRFDILPGGVFNKGFIRAYARFIGADGEALVDGYLQEMAAREAATPGNAPTPSHPGLHRPAEAPRRRTADAPAVERSRAHLQAQALDPADTRAATADAATRAGSAAASPAFETRGADPLSVPAKPSRPLASLLTAVGAAAVVLVLLLGARLFHGTTPQAVRAPVPPSGTIEVPPEAGPQQSEPDRPGDADAAAAADREPTTEAARGAGPESHPGPVAAPIQPAHNVPAPETRVASAIPPPPLPAGDVAPAREPSPPPTPGMEFRIEAAAPVWVQVSCDGEDRLNRSLAAGEGQTLRCLSLIRISATDAGAVRIAVNGARCVPIGDPGTRVEGFAIRFEDFRAICPPGTAARDGHR